MMAYISGLKPFEVDCMAPTDVWVCIDAHELIKREQWEMLRWQLYTTAKYGNSDPKKFPSSPERFMKLWFEEKKTRSSEIVERYARLIKVREAAEKKAIQLKIAKASNG